MPDLLSKTAWPLLGGVLLLGPPQQGGTEFSDRKVMCSDAFMKGIQDENDTPVGVALQGKWKKGGSHLPVGEESFWKSFVQFHSVPNVCKAGL